MPDLGPDLEDKTMDPWTMLSKSEVSVDGDRKGDLSSSVFETQMHQLTWHLSHGCLRLGRAIALLEYSPIITQIQYSEYWTVSCCRNTGP